MLNVQWHSFLPPPLSRCGSVTLDFMMRFNQSVILSSVLTLLSDAARQDKFGVFKVDPDSIKQVFRASDGSESTTKGKCYKECVGSECLIGPNENRKIWHIVEKFIYCPQINHNELRNVVRCFFFPDLPLYSRNFAKTDTSVGSR